MNTLLLDWRWDPITWQGVFVSFFESNGYQCLWAQDTMRAMPASQRLHVLHFTEAAPYGDSFTTSFKSSFQRTKHQSCNAVFAVQQRVEGLMAGAKDYVTKPFLMKSCSRGSSPTASAGCEPPKLRRHPNQLVRKNRFLPWMKAQSHLKPKEFQSQPFLFIQNQGAGVSSRRTAQQNLGLMLPSSTRTVDNLHIPACVRNWADTHLETFTAVLVIV